jgi:hypothetical protein
VIDDYIEDALGLLDDYVIEYFDRIDVDVIVIVTEIMHVIVIMTVMRLRITIVFGDSIGQH